MPLTAFGSVRFDRSRLSSGAAPVRRGRSLRVGMSLIEVLVALSLLAIAAMLTMPKALALRRSAATAAARRQIAAVAEAARASALQRQRPATIRVTATRTGATLTASVDTGGTSPYVVSTLSVAVPVTERLAADSLLTYDARGLPSPRRTAMIVYLLGAATGTKDSVCLSPYGHLLPRNCAL